MIDADEVAECAEHLALIAKDLRAAGDLSLVRLSEDGVTDDYMTLADELWLIAFRLGHPIENDGRDDAGNA